MRDLSFKECPTCAVKPGAPTLCPSCAHNRAVIIELSQSSSSKIMSDTRINPGRARITFEKLETRVEFTKYLIDIENYRMTLWHYDKIIFHGKFDTVEFSVQEP